MQDGSDARLAAFGSDDPGTVLPGWIVPDVLGMTAFEVGDPVVVLILVKADDAALNRGPVRKSQWLRMYSVEPSVVAAWLPNGTSGRRQVVRRRWRVGVEQLPRKIGVRRTHDQPHWKTQSKDRQRAAGRVGRYLRRYPVCPEAQRRHSSRHFVRIFPQYHQVVPLHLITSRCGCSVDASM